MKVKLLKFCLDNKVKYLSAFEQGFNFAYGDESFSFGELELCEDIKHIPKNIKDKDQWLSDWHYGCAVGCEY